MADGTGGMTLGTTVLSTTMAGTADGTIPGITTPGITEAGTADGMIPGIMDGTTLGSMADGMPVTAGTTTYGVMSIAGATSGSVAATGSTGPGLPRLRPPAEAE